MDGAAQRVRWARAGTRGRGARVGRPRLRDQRATAQAGEEREAALFLGQRSGARRRGRACEFVCSEESVKAVYGRGGMRTACAPRVVVGERASQLMMQAGGEGRGSGARSQCLADDDASSTTALS